MVSLVQDTTQPDKIWTAKIGGISNDVVVVDSAYDDWYAMDFSVPLEVTELSIDEAVAPTVVDQSTNLLSTSNISVSYDRKKVIFKTGGLTANRVYDLKVICTTTGTANNLISTGILRT